MVGFEAEFATTPEFFGDSAASGLFSKNDVVTLMGSILLAVPAGPVRLYGAAGGGLMKSRIEGLDPLFAVNSKDFGINVGGGLIWYLGSHVGFGRRRYSGTSPTSAQAGTSSTSTWTWARSTTGGRWVACPSGSEASLCLRYVRRERTIMGA